MARTAGFFATSAVLLSLLAGCNDRPPAGDNLDKLVEQPPVASVQGLDRELPSEPSAVVADFIEALRSGDEVRTLKLLSAKARAELEKIGAAPDPPGSETASFSIGKVERDPDNPDAAYVTCTWSDQDPQSGAPFEYQLTWVLRGEKEGGDAKTFRVAGMVISGEGEEPVVFNYEDPENLQRHFGK